MAVTRDEYEQGFKNPTHKHVIPHITKNGEIGLLNIGDVQTQKCIQTKTNG